MNDNKPENVVEGQFFTKGNINPDRMLLANIGSMKTLLICGYDHDDQFSIGASFPSIYEAIAYLEKAKQHLLDMMD